MRAHRIIYKAASQTVLIYESDIWLVTGVMMKLIEGFHHRADRWIAGMMARMEEDGYSEYPPAADAMEAVGLWSKN